MWMYHNMAVGGTDLSETRNNVPEVVRGQHWRKRFTRGLSLQELYVTRSLQVQVYNEYLLHTMENINSSITGNF